MSATAFQRQRREAAAQAWPEAKSLPTREDIAAMPKGEVKEWLVAHGVDDPNGRVADMRAALVSMIYTDA